MVIHLMEIVGLAGTNALGRAHTADRHEQIQIIRCVSAAAAIAKSAMYGLDEFLLVSELCTI